MVYINIPYVVENNRIDKDVAKKEIEVLDINDSAKLSAYEAIYNLHPRGVNFSNKNSIEALQLEDALKRLGVPYRRSEESEYYVGQDNSG
jgi:hypothetical protein